MKNLNKMSKIALASALALPAAALVQQVPASAATTVNVTTDSTYDYSYDSDNLEAGIKITKFKGTAAGAYIIPGSFTVDGKTLKVTSIGSDAFYKTGSNAPDITISAIPSSVTTIEAGAFGGRTKLGIVHISKNVTSILEGAFVSGVTLKGLSKAANSTNDSVAKKFADADGATGVLFEATDYTVTYKRNTTTADTVTFVDDNNSSLYDLNNEATVKGKPNDAEWSNSELVFQGWSTTSEGSVDYQPGDKIPMTKKETLYAVWGTATSRYVKPEELAFGTTGYTGYIEVLVNNDDKKTKISEALNVKITDKNNAVVKTGTLDAGQFTTDTGANTKGTTVGNLAPGTYFVTLSDDQGNSQTTKATVKAAKTVVKTTWETTLDGITDATTKRITNSGAVTGIVYDAEVSGSTAVDKDAEVIIKNATTSWNVSTDAFGAFKVFVPKGKYDLVIVGEDGAKNQLYPVVVTAGASVAPINPLSTAIEWAVDDKKDLGLVVDDASLTGAIVAPATVPSKASSLFTGKALAGTMVEVYVVDDSGEKLFAGEVKTGAATKGSTDGLGVFKVKVTNPYNAKDPNVLANTKIVFVVTDVAGNSHTSEEKVVPAHAAPALAPATAAGAKPGETILTLPKLTAAENKFVIFASTEATKDVLLGAQAPTEQGNGLFFKVVNGSSDGAIKETYDVTKDAKYAAIYEVDANNKVVKFKDLTLKVKQ